MVGTINVLKGVMLPIIVLTGLMLPAKTTVLTESRIAMKLRSMKVVPVLLSATVFLMCLVVAVIAVISVQKAQLIMELALA